MADVGLQEKLELSEASPHVKLTNPYLGEVEYLYHLGLSTEDGIVERFHDVKFVCMGGKPSRMKSFAEMMYKVLGNPKNSEFKDSENEGPNLRNISKIAGRYSLYKVGPVLSASHGIGAGSISVLLHELLKVLRYAKSTDVVFIRIGTSGGLGADPGTVVITDTAYSALLEPYFKQIACGKEIKCSTKSSDELSNKLEAVAKSLGIKVVRGNTIATNDFYEEQARLDGALCSFTEEEKMNYFRKAHTEHGVVNMEMESACMIAICNRANVKCAVVCACVIDRLLGDAITENISLVKSWELYPLRIVSELIKRSVLE